MKLMMRGTALWIAAIAWLFSNPMRLRADEQANREALTKIRTLYEESVKSDDISKLLPHMSGNLTAVTPTGEEVKGAQELQAYFKKIWDLIGKGGSYQVKVNVTQTDLFGDIAVSYGTTDEVVKTAESKEYKFSMLWTAILRREDGVWKALRMHGSLDPLSNVFVKTQMTAMKWLYGGGGLVIGLIVGLILAGLRRSRA